MANSTVRRFCFTWNNPTELDFALCSEFIKKYCKYGIVGKEIAPTTGTLHLQGFCNLQKPMRFSTIKQRLDNRIHLEKANGSDEENQKYCSKSGDFFEEGSPGFPGRRTDLESLVSSIKNREVTTLKGVAEMHGACFIKYHRGIQAYMQQMVPIQPRDFKTEVYFYWGPPGTGKSRRAAEEARTRFPNNPDTGRDEVYYKPRGLWWDGYEQQKAVVIDDFYGWIKYDEMLKICDRYPYKVQIKGGFQEFKAEAIWITSNVSIDLLYRFTGYDPAALQRRMTCIDYMD
ncbi:putative replication-associated protein [Bat faeces associated cyclovirus 4]|uniref:Replication-associated protein n=1 Tax=Bat faeces associated cyclovirus 4 TaxID=2050587 RepID=G1D7G8_9CIRC|nr:putative replication-associated protein [Bat faeces associated cyclovirus 4]AEL87792.1 putative replication-associated protein [Bat faeces associated cyclovirus 4]